MRPELRWVFLGCVLSMSFAPRSADRTLFAHSSSDDSATWFGVIEAHDAPLQAAELGASWSRARFHWGSIQPSGPDEWIDAELTDDELENELAAEREVIGLLIGIPDWARDELGLPSGLDLPQNDPNNLWASFVRTIVEKYDGRIDHWIIWNEPDIWDPDHPAYSWPGTEADFARLMEVSYMTIKDVNPAATVHLGAMSHYWDVLYDRELYFRRLLDILSADPDAVANNYYYDVATLHLYFNPADVYDIVTTYRDIQQEYGLEKPIWLVETNAPPSNDPAFIVENPTFQISLVEQAAYMPQVLTLARVAGAERVGIYKMLDTPGDFAANPELFGLIRADGTPRPGFSTARVAATVFPDSATFEWRDRHIVSQVVVSTPDQRIRILWVRIPFSQTVSIPALADTAEFVDMWGNRQVPESDGGQYILVLPAGECTQTVGDYCMIGGPPVFVIEPMDNQAESAPNLDLTILEEQTGSVRSDTANALPLIPGFASGMLAAVGVMFGIAWLSFRLRMQVNSIGEID